VYKILFVKRRKKEMLEISMDLCLYDSIKYKIKKILIKEIPKLINNPSSIGKKEFTINLMCLKSSGFINIFNKK